MKATRKLTNAWGGTSEKQKNLGEVGKCTENLCKVWVIYHKNLKEVR